MLEGLDDIDWGSLRHAYGPATDVPEQLRALASPDPSTRHLAMNDLYGNIWHQHTVYQATAYAVPFLIELFNDQNTADRSAILQLLGSIARRKNVEQWQTSYAWQQCNPHFAVPMTREQKQESDVVQAANLAVSDGVEFFLHSLQAPDPDLRVAAAFTLAPLKMHTADAVAPLWHTAQTDYEPVVRAHAVLALSSLLPSDPEQLLRLEQIHQADEADEVQTAAAVALIRIAGPTTPHWAVDVLSQAILDPDRANTWEEISELWSYEADFSSVLQRLGTDLFDYVETLSRASRDRLPAFHADWVLSILEAGDPRGS